MTHTIEYIADVRRDDWGEKKLSNGAIYFVTEPKPTLWTQRDGTEIAVSDMADSHLMNAGRMLYRKYAEVAPFVHDVLAVGITPDPDSMAGVEFEQNMTRSCEELTFYQFWMETFIEELQRRGIAKPTHWILGKEEPAMTQPDPAVLAEVAARWKRAYDTVYSTYGTDERAKATCELRAILTEWHALTGEEGEHIVLYWNRTHEEKI